MNDGKDRPPIPKFRMGQVVVESKASDVLHPDDLQKALEGHPAGHWGQVDTLERHDNDQAVKTGGTITSVYCDRGGNTFWVQTNLERTTTRIMLEPEQEQELEMG